MITLSIILVLLVLGLAFFVFFKLLRGVVKAVIAVLFLVLFVIGILGILIYLDIAKVKSGFNEDQTVLLSHKGAIVAGFVYSNSQDKILESDRLQPLDQSRLTDISNIVSSGNFEKDKGFIIIVDSSHFYDKTVELAKGESINLSEKLINDIFSCEELKDCTKILSSAAPELKPQIENSFEDALDVKNKLFFNLFVQETKDTKGTFLIKGIKEEQISVYPELTTLKLINVIPEKLFNLVLKKSLGNSSELESNSD
jgi:hypothetical protein